MHPKKKRGIKIEEMSAERMRGDAQCTKAAWRSLDEDLQRVRYG